MAENACQEGARLHYPVSEILLLEAAELSVQEYMRVDWDALAAKGAFEPDGTAYRAVVSEALEGWAQPEADMRLLALLAHETRYGGDVMVQLTTASPSAAFDLFVEMLDRQGLEGQARAMRMAKAGFDPWDGTAPERRRQWTDGLGNTTDEALLALLKATSRAYLAAEPKVMNRALELVASNDALLARYAAAREAASDEARLSYMISQLWACAELGWWTPEEAEAALGKLPRAQRDLVVLNIYLGEAFNGSVHQFFSNSSGLLAPELVAVLERGGLPEHAASIRRGMAEFADPYPVETEVRRMQMQSFSEAKDNVLYELTGYADDGEVLKLMGRIGRDAGLWPE